MNKNTEVKKAILIGGLCAIAYLSVYIARNILSAVSPQMIGVDGFTNEYIGEVSAVYLSFYAIGQLINGSIGDKIKSKYMMTFGLILAGVTNLLFPYLAKTPDTAKYIYGLTGFFLSMIYGPMTKVVAENMDLLYATRCSLGYTFSSYLGSPMAGVIAAFLSWQRAFSLSSAILFLMGITCFFMFIYFEKKGFIKYHQFDRPKSEKSGGIKLLIKRQIIKFTFVSVLTGVVRTTVVFWLPNYLAQYLGFTPNQSAGIFTAATLCISMTAFIAVFLYERLGHDMNKTILLVFSLSALFFFLVYLVKLPIVNIVFLVLAIMASNAAATMLWSRYCTSLRDTGMVSGATGFLDFMSYMAASIASTLFANAVADIGWGNLILIWFGLMVVGVIVALPYEKFKKYIVKAE